MEPVEARVSEINSSNVPQVLAELAAKEWEALEVIKADLCQWLTGVLQLDITPANFLDTLDSGEEVCRLASAIQQGALKAEEKGVILSVQVPMAPLSYHTGGTSSFYARDNTSNFISWCRSLGVQEAVMFESEGLVLHKDEKGVILCLLDVARFAERVGIPPPQLVRMEREIEALESLEDKDETSRNKPGDAKLFSPVPVPNYRHHKPLTLTPPLKTFKQGRISRIPVRRSRRLVDRSLPAKNERKSRKRTRSSDEEESPAPSHKRTRVMGEENTKKDWKIAESEGVKESLDDSVMRRMAECTCQNKIEVANCGNGKFIVKGASGRTMTTYARMLSDRLMVRVGGGWDTLDHFLLKHDPCRVHTLSRNR